MAVYRIFGALVKLNSATLCLPSSFLAERSGPSFHPQSQRTARKRRLLFRNVAEVLRMHPLAVFSLGVSYLGTHLADTLRNPSKL